jgi:hypothetical protein
VNEGITPQLQPFEKVEITRARKRERRRERRREKTEAQSRRVTTVCLLSKEGVIVLLLIRRS